MIIHACFIFVLRFTSAGLAMFSVRFGSDEVIKKKNVELPGQLGPVVNLHIYIYIWNYS